MIKMWVFVWVVWWLASWLLLLVHVRPSSPALLRGGGGGDRGRADRGYGLGGNGGDGQLPRHQVQRSALRGPPGVPRAAQGLAGARTSSC